MQPLNAALLINLLGFAVGIALYAMLGLMVVRHRQRERPGSINSLLLTTAALGVLWNAGELYGFVQRDFSNAAIPPILAAAAFAALGFLPSVVVHSAQGDDARVHWLTYIAYGVSIFAAILHFREAFGGGEVPSDLALRTQTFASLALVVGLLVFNLRQTLEKKAIWASALLIFAVSALHLTGEREGSAWYIELAAHQSSLPLAFAILYQNYRFAFADLFLKRAFSLLLLAGLAFGLYVFVAVPLLRYHETHDRDDVLAAALVVGLWIATALAYPLLHKFADWLVDTVFLKRADYLELEAGLVREIENSGSVEAVLDTVCGRLSDALTARRVEWSETANGASPVSPVTVSMLDASIVIQTADEPQYLIRMDGFFGGRRLLSDDIAMLEAVALFTARRIDVIRVAEERFEREFREQEFAKLAAEAQLTALRSQVNPHFLFNALTTIGYLIKSSPDKAYDTLLRLTQLLRGVLRSTGEFSTLGEEIKLIESYLDIERARFEEKLKVSIDIDADAENARVPSLILQPLVENAIKHGVSENRDGGEIRITASIADEDGRHDLRLTVWDSGAGKTARKHENSAGVGLRNIRERLASYYGSAAALTLESRNGSGTEATVILPIEMKRRIDADLDK